MTPRVGKAWRACRPLLTKTLQQAAACDACVALQILSLLLPFEPQNKYCVEIFQRLKCLAEQTKITGGMPSCPREGLVA